MSFACGRSSFLNSKLCLVFRVIAATIQLYRHPATSSAVTIGSSDQAKYAVTCALSLLWLELSRGNLVMGFVRVAVHGRNLSDDVPEVSTAGVLVVEENRKRGDLVHR